MTAPAERPTGLPGRGARAATPIRPMFPSVDKWFNEHFRLTYRRNVGGGTLVWCPEPLSHKEGMLRLTTIWWAWEILRLDKSGLGMSTWLQQHADPQMDRLMSPFGPFALCSIKDGHRDGDRDGNPDYGLTPFPAITRPAAMFAPLRPDPEAPSAEEPAPDNPQPDPPDAHGKAPS